MSLPRLLVPRLLNCRKVVSSQRNFSLTKLKKSGVDGWFYRDNYHPDIHEKRQVFWYKYGSAGFWYWILYHLWHEPEMVFGEFPYQDPALWTDEELGIPPDDYEE